MANVQLPIDDVVDIMKSVMKEVIQIRDADVQSISEEWTTNIEEKVLWNLSKLNKPIKYIVTCLIVQNTGGYVYTAVSSHWDNTTDGTCTVRWEHSVMNCVVTVFGVSI